MLEELASRVSKLEEGHKILEGKVDENTRVTNSIKSDTSTLVEFSRNYKATKLVGGFLAKFLAWAAPIAAVFVALWYSKGKP